MRLNSGSPTPGDSACDPIVQDAGRSPTSSRLVVVALAALGCVLLVLVITVGRPSSDSTSSIGATLAGSPGSSTRCPYVPLESVLADSDLAFSGTIIDRTDQTVVLQVDHVYRGDPTLGTVTIRRGAGVAGSVRASSMWSQGERQLVAARDGVVIECVGGATARWSQETADEYQRALG